MLNINKNKLGTLLLSMAIALWFLYLAAKIIVNEYVCLPGNREEIHYVDGVLNEIERSRRFGDSIFVVDSIGYQHKYTVANQLANDLTKYVGKNIRVGEVSGLMCSPSAMHIESGGEVILDFDTVLLNNKNGAWFFYLMSAIYFVFSIAIGLNGFFLSVAKGRVHR
jgi:hypothetical protein